MPSEIYSQKAHSVIVDGVRIQDFFEGEGAISFAPSGDLVTTNRGLDRNAQSLGSPRPGDLTILLKPTSPSIARLNQIIDAQEDGAPRLFSSTVKAGVDDALSLSGCLLQDNEFGTGGPTMEARSFTIKAANYRKRA